jgi:hypothetical protein
MTTLTTGYADVGKTIMAVPGVVTAVRFRQTPYRGPRGYVGGWLGLVDRLARVGQPPLEIFSEWCPSDWWVPISENQLGLLSDSSIPFRELTLTHCPVSCVIEIDLK